MDLKTISGIIGLTANILLLACIYRNKTTQNFTSWMLWAVINIITAVTTFLQKGNYWLPTGYALGAIMITIFLLSKRQIIWTKTGTITTILVVICLIVWWQMGNFVIFHKTNNLFIWWQMGNKAAIIISVIAMLIASVPQAIDTFKNSSLSLAIIYFIFGMADFLSFLGGSSWSIEEKLYSGSELFVSLFLIVFSIRKIQKISIIPLIFFIV
jgi:hypothetical protein